MSIKHAEKKYSLVVKYHLGSQDLKSILLIYINENFYNFTPFEIDNCYQAVKNGVLEASNLPNDRLRNGCNTAIFYSKYEETSGI